MTTSPDNVNLSNQDEPMPPKVATAHPLVAWLCDEKAKNAIDEFRAKRGQVMLYSAFYTILCLIITTIANRSSIYQQKETLATLEIWLYIYAVSDFLIVLTAAAITFSDNVIVHFVTVIVTLLITLPSWHLRKASGIYLLGLWSDYMYSPVWITVLACLTLDYIEKHVKHFKLFQDNNKKVE